MVVGAREGDSLSGVSADRLMLICELRVRAPASVTPACLEPPCAATAGLPQNRVSGDRRRISSRKANDLSSFGRRQEAQSCGPIAIGRYWAALSAFCILHFSFDPYPSPCVWCFDGVVLASYSWGAGDVPMLIA